jgi:DNA-directed RNA polymerase specialized sigma24 family protein
MTTWDERQRRFEEVYLAYRGSILGYVLRRTDNPDDAADVIAETFLTAWRRLEDVPCDVGARLWLYGVARRVLANHHRGVRRRSALTERLRADRGGFPSPAARRKGTADAECLGRTRLRADSSRPGLLT